MILMIEQIESSAFEAETIDKQAILMMYMILNRLHQSGEENSEKCFKIQEKIIYASIIFGNIKQRNTDKNTQIPPIQALVNNFVQKINRLVMQNYEKQNILKQSPYYDLLMNKAVTLLMTPQLPNFYTHLIGLAKLKILTLNNLACIYKKKKKYGIALRAVSFALTFQQHLLKGDNCQQKYDIIPTYLNKAAIYSDMNKHDKAIQEIMRSKKCIQLIQQQILTQIETTTDEQQKKRLTQKRYYGLYMKMIINYNMGVQKQHLRHFPTAIDYYQQGKQLSIIINNKFMTDKFDGILEKLRPMENVNAQIRQSN